MLQRPQERAALSLRDTCMLRFEARAWRTSFAPMFSTGSSSSTSLATVTPSFTIRGEPYLLSSTTLRPCTPGHISSACMQSTTR